MKIYFYLISLSAIIFACSGNNTKNNQNQKTTTQKIESRSIFLSNSEVQGLINSNRTFFMGYWPGMSKDQVNEVTRYLLSKEEIDGIVYDPDDDSSSFKWCMDFSVNFNDKCGYRKFKESNFYLLKSDKSKKLTVLIGGTWFEIVFKYTYINNTNVLSGINLLALSEQTITAPIDYRNFERLAKLYIEKYGEPIQKKFNPPNKGSLSFKTEDIEIYIYYLNAESLPNFGIGFAPNQIHVEYRNISIINKAITQYQSEKQIRDNENQRINDSIGKAERRNSIRRI
jgi:hypothetical protein